MEKNKNEMLDKYKKLKEEIERNRVNALEFGLKITKNSKQKTLKK